MSNREAYVALHTSKKVPGWLGLFKPLDIEEVDTPGYKRQKVTIEYSKTTNPFWMYVRGTNLNVYRNGSYVEFADIVEFRDDAPVVITHFSLWDSAVGGDLLCPEAAPSTIATRRVIRCEEFLVFDVDSIQLKVDEWYKAPDLHKKED